MYLDKTPSPYGGQVYVAPTPPSDFSQSSILLPPIDNMMSWTPSTSTGGNINLQQPSCYVPPPLNETPTNDLSGASAVSLGSGIGSLLDMDRNQFLPFELNSGDLTMLDTNNLSETFTQNLSLTDAGQETNMTDSLNRLATNAYEKIYNDTFKQPPQ